MCLHCGDTGCAYCEGWFFDRKEEAGENCAILSWNYIR